MSRTALVAVKTAVAEERSARNAPELLSRPRGSNPEPVVYKNRCSRVDLDSTRNMRLVHALVSCASHQAIHSSRPSTVTWWSWVPSRCSGEAS